MAVAPFRMVAQIPAVPAATSESAAPASAAQAKETAKPEAAKQEGEEDTSVYRHTALVQSVAKALNLPVETTARGFEFINFLILALLVGIPLLRTLPKVIRKRSQTLSRDIEAARKTSEDANVRLSAVETKLSQLDEEIAKIRAHVEEESQQDEVRIKASIEEESARIVVAAEQEIDVAAAQARRGLRHFAADLAIEQAAKQMTLTPEADRALIAEFVSDVAKGEQN
jgi:F-type H+-transporting ATPase subunit b